MNEFEKSPASGEEAVESKNEGLPKIAPDLVEQEHGDEFDDIVPTRGYQMTPMVGLGARRGAFRR